MAMNQNPKTIVSNINWFSLRAKITLGILLTGGLALGILSYLAVTRSEQIISTISGRLESSVRLLAEEQLVNTVQTEATHADQFFGEIERTVDGLAKYRVSLQDQQGLLNQGKYWDAASSLTQLAGGQYGNSASELSSVLVPTFVTLDDAALADLNTSAYMDFSAPQALAANPALLAIYNIDTKGIVRYYPNVKLASLVPPDFNATNRDYYKITSPLFNQQRTTRWATPYIDAAGGGLVVTVASPVYYDNDFNGIVAADIKLSNITGRISSVSIGRTGFVFILDDAGHIISMPDQGYALFGIDRSAFPTEEFFKQTILNQGPKEIQSIARRMIGGGNGINTIKINGVDTYISFVPIKTNGYSIALVVPVSEMQTAIAVAHNETNAQIQSAVRVVTISLIILLLGAVLISLGLGQLISAPVLQLTEVASKITAGDLNLLATTKSRDEIGTLANAFNSMTTRLRESMMGLEKNVADRTAELETANRQVTKRAAQLQAITELSEAISQLQNLSELFSATTNLISIRFGFYHVGIFLIENEHEYAIMQAANSEGGQRMLARGHRLKLGTGVVGFAAQAGQPRIALDVGADAVFFDNPDLPATRSEVALPLKSQGETIGILDVQSTEAGAFSDEDLQVLTALANQVSIALENTRLLTETRAALAQVQEVYDEFTRAEWSRTAAKAEQSGFRYQTGRIELIEELINTPEVVSAVKTGQVVMNQPNGSGEKRATVAIPVKLRGEVIGILQIESNDPSKKWETDEISLVEAVAERAAFAMENARLFQDARRRAAKERLISEATTKISGALNIENILQTTAQELERVLGGSEVLIKFKSKEKG